MSLVPAASKAENIERVIVSGDLSRLGPEERVSYYNLVCESVGLNPLTKPFEFIKLNGRDVLYARKDATDQLRKVHNVSIQIVSREMSEDCYVVTARAVMAGGRADESIGAVPLGNLKGEARSNALMKAETKAKRRVTLSICGLGMLDETEIESIPASAFTVTEAPRVQESIAPPPLPPPAQAPPKVEYTSGAEGKRFHLKFKDALDVDLRPDADAQLYAFLQHRKFVDQDGRPSMLMVPKDQLPELWKAAFAFAQELNKAKSEEE